MTGRTLLGAADVPDVRLAEMVADSLGVPHVELLTCSAEVAAYDIEALTTAGRYWVRGTACHDGVTTAFSFFVKVVQSWSRSPAFAMVPQSLREAAEASLPWRTEPALYRSDLGDRLPQGLSMPRAYAVLDVDDESAAMWLGAVEVDVARWGGRTFERAAYLLGRLAVSPSVAPLQAVGNRDVVRRYADGRVAHQVLPALRSNELWAHPLVAGAFSAELRARLLEAAQSLTGLVDELDAAPVGTAHGDACPRNLLVARGAPDDFVLIDFGFWSRAPLGFDLTQLLLGELQLGQRPSSELAELEEVCLGAYVRGLRDEGCTVPVETVRRAHAILMLLFWGLSAVPLEVMFGRAGPGAPSVVRERARAADFVLDLVEGTSPSTSTSTALRPGVPS